MNKAQGVRLLSIKLPADVRDKLAAWAADNISSLNAEIVRSVRDRAEREERERITG
jgi:hypothetical protein